MAIALTGRNLINSHRFQEKLGELANAPMKIFSKMDFLKRFLNIPADHKKLIAAYIH